MSFWSASLPRDLIKMKNYMDAEAGARLVKHTILHAQQLNVGARNFSITDRIQMYDFYLAGKIIKYFLKQHECY